MNQHIRSLFPAASKYTYLNSAAVSPVPTPAVAAVAAQLTDASENGALNFNDWVATKNRTRATLAQMLKVQAEQVAFLRNTSDGFASIAAGLKWEKGDNIVSFEKEFPANFYAWRRVRDDFGVELRLCPERAGRIDLGELIAMIDGNTKVVALSAVQFASGFKSDLERVGRAARAVDALFCVDIIQGLGAMPFDLPAQYVDAACGASHKWLCAPEGCGYIYLSDKARERVNPTFVGWISVDEPWDFEDREQQFKPNALAWESGTGPASLFYGLEQSLKILNQVGAKAIESHLAQLTDHLCESLNGRDYEIVSSRRPAEKSAIVCIRHIAGRGPVEIAKHLEQQGVIVSPRGDRVRIAPHLYNNLEDIDRLVGALP